MLVIGDSYTVGVGALPGKSWAQVAARQLGWQLATAAESRAGYVEMGVHGHTIGDLESAAAHRGNQPDVVVIAAGLNDAVYGRDTDLVKGHAHRTIVAAAKDFSTARLVVIGPWGPGPQPRRRVALVEEALREVTAALGVRFIDPVVDGWIGSPVLVSDDHIHPTPAGHERLGQQAARALRP